MIIYSSSFGGEAFPGGAGKQCAARGRGYGESTACIGRGGQFGEDKENKEIIRSVLGNL